MIEHNLQKNINNSNKEVRSNNYQEQKLWKLKEDYNKFNSYIKIYDYNKYNCREENRCLFYKHNNNNNFQDSNNIFNYNATNNNNYNFRDKDNYNMPINNNQIFQIALKERSWKELQALFKPKIFIQATLFITTNKDRQFLFHKIIINNLIHNKFKVSLHKISNPISVKVMQ